MYRGVLVEGSVPQTNTRSFDMLVRIHKNSIGEMKGRDCVFKFRESHARYLMYQASCRLTEYCKVISLTCKRRMCKRGKWLDFTLEKAAVLVIKISKGDTTAF